jgi:hypothetical protein
MILSGRYELGAVPPKSRGGQRRGARPLRGKCPPISEQLAAADASNRRTAEILRGTAESLARVWPGHGRSARRREPRVTRGEGLVAWSSPDDAAKRARSRRKSAQREWQEGLVPERWDRQRFRSTSTPRCAPPRASDRGKRRISDERRDSVIVRPPPTKTACGQG